MVKEHQPRTEVSLGVRTPLGGRVEMLVYNPETLRPNTPPVLVLSGWGTVPESHEGKNGLFDLLTKNGHQVLANSYYPPTRVRRLSEETKGDQVYKDEAQGIVEALKGLGIKKLNLLGWSRGVSLGVEVMEELQRLKEQGYPTVEKALLTGPTGMRQQDNVIRIVGSFIWNHIRDQFSPDVPKEQQIYERPGYKRVFKLRATDEEFAFILRHPILRLRQITYQGVVKIRERLIALSKRGVHIRMLYGERDPLFPKQHSQDLPGIPTEVIPHIGHFAFIDNPQIFIPEISAFFAEEKLAENQERLEVVYRFFGSM